MYPQKKTENQLSRTLQEEFVLGIFRENWPDNQAH